MSYRQTTFVLVLGSAIAAAATGCGGGGSKESKSAKTACKAAATTKPTGLPAAFPAPGELTFTQATKDGPTVVVDGYWTAGLDETYKEFTDQVEQAGYTVTSSEKEDHDARSTTRARAASGRSPSRTTALSRTPRGCTSRTARPEV